MHGSNIYIKYVGAAHDYSGYGEAARHDIGALIAAGIQVSTQIPRYCLEISDFGHLGKLASDLMDKQFEYKIKIIHTTPNTYRQFMEQGKYHIGRVFWETDKLPEEFAPNVQLMDEIWTGSEYNANAIRKAGVTKPIFIVPEAIDIFHPPAQPYILPYKDDFKFYSIFEWTERKNPAALLEAYWREFENTPGVSLSIKTYVDNFTPEKKGEIYMHARRIKNSLGLKNYAPLWFWTRLMDRHQMYRFHNSFDCFVSAHRGEGWGIPQMEAMLMNKPIISTNCGGIHEYLHNNDTALLPSFTLKKLHTNYRNMHWYTPDQQWAEVSIDHLRELMRYAFDNREKVKEMGIKGGKLIQDTFSLEAVGNRMAIRLYEITQKING